MKVLNDHVFPIQGRTTAGSTAFKFQVWDNEGNLLWSRGSQVVTTMETWSVGIDITPNP